MNIKINSKNLSFTIVYDESSNSKTTPYVCDNFQHFKNLYLVLLKDIEKDFYEHSFTFLERCEKEGV